MPCSFLFNETAPTEIYTLSLHDALPISVRGLARLGAGGLPPRRLPLRGRLERARRPAGSRARLPRPVAARLRSEEHTSELQSQSNLVCRLLLEKKNIHP